MLSKSQLYHTFKNKLVWMNKGYHLFEAFSPLLRYSTIPC